MYRADGPAVYANQAGAQILGGTVEDILKGNFRELDSWKENGLLTPAELTLQTGSEETIEIALTSTYRRRVGLRVRFFRFKQDDVPYLLCLFSEITHELDLRVELKKVRDRLQATFNAMTNGVTVQSNDGTILECNPSAETILGLSRDQIMGRTSLDPRWFALHEDGRVFPGEDHPSMVCLRTGKPCLGVTMGLNLPDGSRKWIDINAEPMFLEDSSKPSGVVVTFQDITEKRRLDQELRESERKFRTYVDQAAEAFFAHDFEGKFLDVNQRACDSVGYSRDELMAMTIMDISFNFDLPAAQAQWRNLHPGRSSVQTGWQRRKDGSIFPVEAKLSCYRHLDSILFIVLVQDLTERHRIEQEKLEMEGNRQRMLQEQSLNRLTGAVAHHFNNQLQAVMMALENATLQLPASSQTNEILILAMSAASEAADISRKMNTYLGESHRPRVAVDLAKFIRDFLPILESSKPIGITVSASFSLPGPIIQADVDLLEQAFSALFLNASEACLQKEGRIGICVKTVPAKERPKTRFWPSTFQWLESTYACLEVRDNGVGISQESTLSVFEPFYSTKFAGRGLGLATALGAAIAHQGSITVESQLDRGSVFRIFFPIDRN